jgi:hypothetical protein
METSELTQKVGEDTQLNWEAFDRLITSNQCKIKNIAESLGVKQADLRQSLVAHYGDRIEFKRGRHGGVRWKA